MEVRWLVCGAQPHPDRRSPTRSRAQQALPLVEFHSLKGTVVETVSPFTFEYRQYKSGRRPHWRHVVEGLWQGGAHKG